jgi:hypothetical protein
MSRFTLPRESYIPKTYEAKVTPKGLDDVTIYFERTATGKVCAKGFSGKRAKPDFNYSFGTNEQRRAEFVAEYVSNLRANRDRKAANRAEAKQFRHTLAVGDILYSSWGYDQTNIDFYQVVERSTFSVVIREIAQASCGTTGPDSWKTMPASGQYTGEPMTKRVRIGNCVRIASYANASPWDGSPKHASTGH